MPLGLYVCKYQPRNENEKKYPMPKAITSIYVMFSLPAAPCYSSTMKDLILAEDRHQQISYDQVSRREKKLWRPV